MNVLHVEAERRRIAASPRGDENRPMQRKPTLLYMLLPVV